jgi:copper chaperone
MKHEVFQVENIKCDGCMTTIRKDLLKQTGILTVHVDAEKQMVEVTGDDNMDRLHVISRLEHLGYPLAGNNDLLSKAKSFVSCAVGRFDKMNES